MAFELRIEGAELAKRSIFLGVPMYGGQCFGTFCRSTIDLAVKCAQRGIGLKLHFLFNESLITRARNYVADEFMRSDCSHLMFIDSDIGFNPDDVIAMLAMMGDDAPYDVLGGPYPKKCISWEKIKVAVDKGFADKDPQQLNRFVGDFVFNPLGGQHQIKVDEPCEVLETGTGFMMIRRRAFELMNKNRPDLLYRPDHVRTANFDGTREIMAYFMDPIDRHYPENDMRAALEAVVAGGSIEIAKTALQNADEKAKTMSKRLLSEDYFFCQEVRKAGGKVWLCPWMKLEHTGSHVYGGSLIDIAQLGVSATADPELLRKNRAAAEKK